MPNVEVLEDVAGASSIKARQPEASTSLSLHAKVC